VAAIYTLLPNTDDKADWVEVPAGTSWSILNEPISQPTVPGTSAGYIESTTDAQLNKNHLTTFALGNETTTGAVLWAYIDALANHRLSITVLDGTGWTKIGSSDFDGPLTGWVSVTYTGVISQSVLDALRIQAQLTELAAQAGTSKVYATYLAVMTDGTKTYGQAGDQYGYASSTYGDLGPFHPVHPVMVGQSVNRAGTS